MPAFPYAKLKVSLNGGALQTGAITGTFGQSVQLSSEDTAHPQTFRYEIYEYPNGFPCPAGWSIDPDDGFTYYYAAGPTPPAWSLPSDTSLWGKFFLRLKINNGDPGVSGLDKSQFDDTSTAIQVFDASGVPDVGYGEAYQFDTHRGATGAIKAALRLLAIGLGGGFGTISIADHAVTYIKIQQVAASSVIGNPTGVTANAQAISVGGGIEFSGSAMQRSALTGDVTASAGSNATTIAALAVTTGKVADNAITFAKEQQIAAGVVGNDSGTANQKLITLGTGLAFAGGQLTVSGLALSSFATIGAHTFLGNNTGSSAAPIALTATELTAELNVATTTLKGLVPAPTTATGKFLKDDLTWATASGSFTNPANPGDNAKISYASAGAIAYATSVKTDGTYLAFGGVDPTVLTIGTERFAHATHVLSGLGSDGTTNYDLAQWGVGTNNRWLLGSSTVPLTELQGKQLKATATAQSASALTPTIALTGGAHTTLTASTEVIDLLVDLAQTKQWATGALTTQRGFRVTAPTLAFVAASTVTTAATMAIAGAPTAGTNATLTQSLALWLESGALGFGSSAALTGLTRFAQNSLVAVGRSSTSTDVNLIRWGVGTTDQLALGDDGAASILVSAVSTVSFRLGAAPEWDFSTTQFDCHLNNIVNLAALNGVKIAAGPLGSALTDADVTLSVAGGTIYELNTALTANRVIKLGITGTPRDKQVISIRKFVTGSFTITVTDETGTNVLYVFPAGAKGIADFQYSSSSTHFVLAANADLS